jgi:asparagine synthase (glutamine-hydrolysing)
MTTAYVGTLNLNGSKARCRRPLKLAQWQADKCFSYTLANIAVDQWLLTSTLESNFSTFPLYHPSGCSLLCGDIRLDNREQLIDELTIGQLHAVVTDEQIVLSSYARWGAECLQHLVGDFAFALWDKERQLLFITRSPMGYKTVYYYHSPAMFIFSNSIKAILDHPDVDAKLDEAALAHTMVYTATDGEDTCYQNIKLLNKMSYLVYKNKKVTLTPCWFPENIKKIHYQNEQEYLDHYYHLFEQAVEGRLRSNAPVMSQLSGGLDSSTVTSLAAKILAKKQQRLSVVGLVARENKILTPKNWNSDDSDLMQSVADQYNNIDLEYLSFSNKSFLPGLKAYNHYSQEPLRNVYNQLWLNDMAQLAIKKGCRVVLTGQMGNMAVSWAGRPPYNLARDFKKFINRHGYHFARTLCSGFLGRESWKCYSAISKSFADKHSMLFKAALRPPFVTFGKKTISSFYNACDQGPAYGVFESLFGIEFRDPTSDRRLVEFCCAMPERLFRDKSGSRLVIRKAMKGVVPDEILSNTTRGTQGADWYLNFDNEISVMRSSLKKIKQSSFKEYIDVEQLNTFLDQWRVPNFSQEKNIDPELFSKYRFKFMRALSAYYFYEKVAQQKNTKSKRSAERKKLR